MLGQSRMPCLDINAWAPCFFFEGIKLMDIIETKSGSRGGPATPEGKARSRMNALTHGMTAVTLIEDTAGEQRFIETELALFEELQPSGLVQQVIVRQLARDTLAMELTGQQIRAIARHAVQCLAKMNRNTLSNDAMLHALTETPAFALAQRYHAAAVGRFQRGLLQLSKERFENKLGCYDTESHPVRQEPTPEERTGGRITYLRRVFCSIPGTADWLISLLKAHKKSECENRVAARVLAGEIATTPMAQPPTDIGIDQLEADLSTTFLARTHLPRHIALGLAAEVMADPEVSLSNLRERVDVKRRKTLQAFCQRLRQNGETNNDWVLKGLRKGLGLSMES